MSELGWVDRAPAAPPRRALGVVALDNRVLDACADAFGASRHGLRMRVLQTKKYVRARHLAVWILREDLKRPSKIVSAVVGYERPYGLRPALNNGAYLLANNDVFRAAHAAVLAQLGIAAESDAR